MIKDFRATFASFEMKTSDHGENSKIMEFFKDEYLSFGQDILSYRKVYISSVHLDLIDDKGLLKKLVSPWIRKTVACFLKKEVNPKPIYLMIKNNNKDLISEHEIKVGNCECNVSSNVKCSKYD